MADILTQERFDYAKTYKMGFGKYRGQELNQIACDGMGGIADDGAETGLLYLDWLMKWDKLGDTARNAIEAFLCWPPVAEDLKAAKEQEAARRS